MIEPQPPELTPEHLTSYVPGWFRYEREAAMADRVIEAHRVFLRGRVEALGLEHPDAAYNEAISDVLALLDPP